jgi:uncharacterized protein YbcI
MRVSFAVAYYFVPSCPAESRVAGQEGGTPEMVEGSIAPDTMNEHEHCGESAQEVSIADAIRHFEQEYMGRSSRYIRVYLVKDIAVVRARGMLSPAERQLASTHEGRVLIKQLWVKEMEGLKSVLRYRLECLIGIPLSGLTLDIDPREDEWIAVIRLRPESSWG